jgi:hypothetical protein
MRVLVTAVFLVPLAGIELLAYRPYLKQFSRGVRKHTNKDTIKTMS